MIAMTDSTEDQTLHTTGKNERLMKEMAKIRDLDVSIREMDFQLKTARSETQDVHLKNREELKKQLFNVKTRETALDENARRFFNLFSEPEKIDMSDHDETVENEKTTKSEEDLEIDTSMKDEDKRRLEFLTNDSTDYSSLINPFRICESPGEMLQEDSQHFQC